MKENMIGKDFEEPVEPQFDAVLHFEMHCVAEELAMTELMSYAEWKRFKALAYEPLGFYPVVEVLYEVVPEHVIATLEDRLAETTISKEEVFEEFRKTTLSEWKEALSRLVEQFIVCSDRSHWRDQNTADVQGISQMTLPRRRKRE
jgi:hypothetical protein